MARLTLPRSFASAAVVALVLVDLAGCGDDDGADVRDAQEGGQVGIIGPAPEGGGGSISAVATGCTTRGATTLLSTTDLQIGLDEWSVGDGEAGVVRVVAKNFGAVKHEILVVKGSSTAGLPKKDGVVDIESITTAARILPFEGNTICQAPFELGPGTYVVFDNQGPSEASGGVSYLERGMSKTFTLR